MQLRASGTAPELWWRGSALFMICEETASSCVVICAPDRPYLRLPLTVGTGILFACLPSRPPYLTRTAKSSVFFLCFPFHLFCLAYIHFSRSRGSSVGIATGCGLDDRGVEVRVHVRQKFSFLHIVQTGSGLHPTSYPMCTRGPLPAGKAAGA
jgi:hypothetical protein